MAGRRSRFPDLETLIRSPDPEVRNLPVDAWCAATPAEAWPAALERLDRFWRESDNLYERVRALFFLHAIHRFHLCPRLGAGGARIPYAGYRFLLDRRFEEAIDVFRAARDRDGEGALIASALAAAYGRLGFQTLADQVRASVRSVRGNQWAFRMGHAADHPLRVRPELTEPDPASGAFPLLHERTPVRMDLSHSAWSDIFFLGMDYPEGARVLNVSIDLAVRGRDPAPEPPVNAYLRVIDRPVLRLVSVDLGASADITSLAEVFDFARDYLGLLKAAVIASGLVPPGLEGSGQDLADVLRRLVGPGRGLELVSHVNGIPKGSRLAVSTNLLAALIAVCMRATGQTGSLDGPLAESERRVVAARAILGEWLGGSGGGWQDSGGVWPGMKLIEGVPAGPEDPEFGISRGRLLPRHTIFSREEVPEAARRKLQDSLVLVHGGLAQNVGPILEMVTEKYLLRSEREWQGRQEALGLMDGVVEALEQGDIRALGEITTRNFFGPIQTIIPWASNAYTESLIDAARARFGDRFWGFWMLGGMSGGGMGFMFDTAARAEAQDMLLETMTRAKADLEHALPFAMDPVVYDFRINEDGTFGSAQRGSAALLPPAYYAQALPRLVRLDPREITPARRAELDGLTGRIGEDPRYREVAQNLYLSLVGRAEAETRSGADLARLLETHGFDPRHQEEVRAQLRAGRLGLAQNRLPSTARLEDARPGDVMAAEALPDSARRRGEQALREGEVGVVTLAAGTGSRWSGGAGVVKALNPFCRLAGRHRDFLEVHLAKTRRAAVRFGADPIHVFTTSYLTHGPIAATLERRGQYGWTGPVRLSPGRSIGLRMVPMARDLRFAWEESPQQRLDEQAQKVRESLHAALLGWAEAAGEGSDYTDNLPLQCLHPVGHWFEVPNLLLNGILRDMLRERPGLRWLMLHNIDTVGADLDPALLGAHIESGRPLTFEVIARRIEDTGGGLARVDGRLRLVEGLALPREDLEFEFSWYNSMTTWIDLDQLLATFGLARKDLDDRETVAARVRDLAARIPTYITLKDVKKRWGQGQEDVFPVSQYEKLWGDMSALPELDCGYVAVPRTRGQQLKDPAQLDGWVRDGSAAAVESLCEFG